MSDERKQRPIARESRLLFTHRIGCFQRVMLVGLLRLDQRRGTTFTRHRDGPLAIPRHCHRSSALAFVGGTTCGSLGIASCHKALGAISAYRRAPGIGGEAFLPTAQTTGLRSAPVRLCRARPYRRRLQCVRGSGLRVSILREPSSRPMGRSVVGTAPECEGRISMGPAHSKQVSSSDSICPATFGASWAWADFGPKR